MVKQYKLVNGVAIEYDVPVAVLRDEARKGKAKGDLPQGAHDFHIAFAKGERREPYKRPLWVNGEKCVGEIRYARRVAKEIGVRNGRATPYVVMWHGRVYRVLYDYYENEHIARARYYVLTEEKRRGGMKKVGVSFFNPKETQNG